MSKQWVIGFNPPSQNDPVVSGTTVDTAGPSSTPGVTLDRGFALSDADHLHVHAVLATVTAIDVVLWYWLETAARWFASPAFTMDGLEIVTIPVRGRSRVFVQVVNVQTPGGGTFAVRLQASSDNKD